MEKTIEYILEVAKCEGISKAAKKLYITPSALSKFVQVKEEELQVKLFHREGKKFVLTYAGERYVELLKKMLDVKQEMDIEMRRISSMYKGRLRIGFQMSLAETMVLKVMPEFRKKYPHIQIMVEESYSAELLRLLRNNELDLVLSVVEEEEPDLKYQVVREGNVVMIAGKDSPLKEKAIKKEGFSYPWLDAEDYRDEPAVMYAEHQVYRRYADRNYNNYNIEPKVDLLVTRTKTALLCVSSGQGVTITSELLVEQQHFEDKVEMFSFGENQIRDKLAVVSSNNSIFVEERQGFIEIVNKYFTSKKVE